MEGDLFPRAQYEETRVCAWVCGGTRHSFVLIIRRALLSFSSSLSRLVRIVSARDVRCTPTGVWERERCLATQRGHVAGSGTAVSGEDGSGPPERTGATGNSTCANHINTHTEDGAYFRASRQRVQAPRAAGL